VRDTYTHGHHESVLRSHTWRTAENSAAYLLPHLRPGQRLLDAGCGPGTITLDLADRVAPGRVVGVDAAADVVARAEAQRVADARGDVEFRTADLYALPFDDASFDVVHAHQVLQHLSDPVGALREMRRVVDPAGLVAVRDSDYGGFVWAPDDPLLDRWLALYHDVTARNRADADAGRRLVGWARAAGFREVTASSSTWTFAEAADRRWWGDLWADRMEQSAVADQAREYGLTDDAELAAIAAAFRRWAEEDDGCFIVLHGEVLARP
jgi:SAM-dependent methyltransferase